MSASQRESNVTHATWLLLRQRPRWYEAVPLDRALDASLVLCATGFVAMKASHCLRNRRACPSLRRLTNLWIRKTGLMAQKIACRSKSWRQRFPDLESKNIGGHGRRRLPVWVT